MASIVVKSPIRHQSSRAGGRDRDASAVKPKRSAETEPVTQLSLTFGKCSLSKTDSQIISLIQHIPRKKTTSNSLENFYLYLPALKLYKAVTANEPPSEEDAGLPDKAIRRKVYQLVFDTLYHFEVLQELLVDSSFFSRYFHTHSDEALLHLMLFDLQNSKFSLKLKANETGSVPEPVARMAEALWSHRTKLNATLARMRVEERALKIHQLIPDCVSRKKYESNNQYYCYTRVNPIKVRDVQTQVVDKLLQQGFIQVDSEDSLTQKSMHLLEDDLVVFSPDCREWLDELELVESGCLVLQDVRSYEFVDGIRKKIEACSGDVIVTEPNSGVEIAHIATLLGYRGTVIVYNTQSIDTSLIRENLHSLEIRNVKFLDMPFACTSSEDDLFEDVQIIVCLSTTPPSSHGNLVDYALQEGDCRRLKSFLLPPKMQEKRDEEDKSILINSIANALTFNQVEHIFMKLSEADKKQDMEAAVSETLEEYNAKAEKTGIKNFIISFDSDESDEDNAGFTIAIQREPDKPPTPPRRIIDRAIANGVIDGEGISDETIHVVKKRRKSKATLSSIPMMTFAAQQKVVKKKEPTNNKIFRI